MAAARQAIEDGLGSWGTVIIDGAVMPGVLQHAEPELEVEGVRVLLTIPEWRIDDHAITRASRVESVVDLYGTEYGPYLIRAIAKASPIATLALEKTT